MKDKLVKTGHKKLYYRLKATLAVFLFVLAVTGAALLPIAISYQVADQAHAKADAGSSVSSGDPETVLVSSSTTAA